jgi:D-sedoheptulose 7-phosphate isomerase
VLNNYEQKYIQSLNLGLLNTVMRIDSVKTDSNVFFESLVELLKNSQKNNGNIYFFGNGASASFSNHMALDWSKNGGILSFS